MSSSTPFIRGNSLYKIVDGPSWTEAEANSVKLGGHLATVSNQEENIWLTGIIDKDKWIGLNDIEEDGIYKWISGEIQADFLPFGPYEGPFSPTNDPAYNSPSYAWLKPYKQTHYHDYAFQHVTVEKGEWLTQADTWRDSPVNASGIAEIPFIRRGDSAYVIVEGPTWEEAEANANALGGHLVTINDAEENEWISTELRDGIMSKYNLQFGKGIQSDEAEEWRFNPLIGFSDHIAEGYWVWAGGDSSPFTNGESDSYTNWVSSAYGQAPYGFKEDESDYAVMYMFGRVDREGVLGKWDDTTGGNIGIAEIPLAPNNTPTGSPTITGDFKVGQTINIDASSIKDADNFEGWTPTYKYTWEIADDPGMTMMMPVWESLDTPDATDDDERLEITDDLTGKLIRGVVSYMDGYGTNEILASESLLAINSTTKDISDELNLITHIGGNREELTRRIFIDSNEKLIVTGYTYSSNLLGVPTSGHDDLYAAKFESNGENIWTKIYGTRAWEEADNSTIDGEGNIYFTGTSSYDLNGESASGNDNALVMKLNPKGEHQWTRFVGSASSGRDNAKGAVVDDDGNIYVTGDSEGTVGEDPNRGDRDIFLSKLSSEGEIIWARSWGSSQVDRSNNIEIDGNGDIYLTGYTRGDFNGMASSGGNDALIMKLNPNGEILWQKQFGGRNHDVANSIAVTNIGELFISGDTHGERGENKINQNIFLAKFDPENGEKIWIKEYGTDSFDSGKLIYDKKTDRKILIGKTSGDLSTKKTAGDQDQMKGFVIELDSQDNVRKIAQSQASSGDVRFADLALGNSHIYVLAHSNANNYMDTTNKGATDSYILSMPLSAINRKPTGKPTLTGDLKVGQTISIDASAIEDADNFEGWSPTYKYTWEIANDPGMTKMMPVWESLNTPDATDGDESLEITDNLRGKLIRGVVGYMDGYGTNELVESDEIAIEANKAYKPVIRGNSLYKIVDGPSWTEAEANAVKLGGHLVTVNTREENEWLGDNADAFNQKYYGKENWELNAWIGLNDIEVEGVWKWSSGETFDFQAWGPGAPSSYVLPDKYDYPLEDRTEDYVHIIKAPEDAYNHEAGVHWNNTYLEAHIAYDKQIPELNGIAEIPFIRRGDSAYVIVEGPTWEEAEANANALGGHLVTINDEGENEWIVENIKNLAVGVNKGDAFIGLRRVGGDDPVGIWEWSNGETLNYTNWYYDPYWGFGQRPNIENNPDGQYAHIYLSYEGREIGIGKWNDGGNETDFTWGLAEIPLAPNNAPIGTPKITGDFKVGQKISIDASSIEDADNFEGWTPTYKYTWEIADDPHPSDVLPTWESLNTPDATDGDENLEITDDLTGKLIRGVVSYMDGYGTNETVYSSEQKLEVEQRTISLPTDLTTKVGQIIEIPITINQAEGIQALDLNFAFDSERFSVPPTGELVRAGSIISDWTLVGNANADTETLKISAFASEPLSSVSGELAYLRLQVKGDAPSGDAIIDLLSASLNENELEVDLKDGALLITAPKISIASDLTAPIGGSIDIPITIDDAAELQSLDLVFAYDPDIFSVPTNAEIVSASDLTGDWSFASNTATPGEIKISGFGTTPLEGGEGGLINLNLKVNSGIETGSVLLDLVSASFNEGQMTADVVDGSLELLPPTFQVADVRQLSSGLVLVLSEAPDLEKLNLYDGQDASVDQPDLQLTRSDGSVVDDLSIHWKAETNELYLIQTDSLTGISKKQFAAGASPFQSDRLAEGDYELVIDARSDGLISASSGELIDGNGDGITGDAFSYSFTKKTPTNVISIGDTTRGSGQSLGLNGIAHSNDINGLPVLVSTTADIRSISGNVSYDATAFDNASLVVGHDLPDDWTLDTKEDEVGLLNYTASGVTAITGTDQELFRFDAVVSEDAAYGSSTLIEATIETPEDPDLNFESDPSLVVLAYSGDTTGNGGHSSLDASRIQRVVVGLDSGFDAFDTLAPTLIGDTTGNGGLSSLDASRVQQEVVGLPVDTFPSIPVESII